MANEVEIVVTTTYKPGDGLARARADASQQASALASDVDAKLRSIRDVEIGVDYDDSAVRRAEADIRALDALPDPKITPTGDAREAVSSIEDQLGGLDVSNLGGAISSGLTSSLAAAGPVVGLAMAAFGDDLIEGFTRGMTAGQRTLETQIRTGFGEAQAREIGSAAGDAYGSGFGDSASQALDAAITLERKLGEIDPSVNLQEASEWALTLANHLGIDVAEAATLAGRMIQQGLADNTEQAFDIMIDAAQRYGAESDEVLEATREFGGVLQKLGLDGAASVRFVGDAYDQGVTSQIERALEALEEFNTRITDGDSREAVEALGFSFEEMQSKLADGRGAEALGEIATGLLENVDAAERATRANEIFGTSFETTGQIDKFLALIVELSEAEVDLAGTAKEAADQAQESVTAWDMLSRKMQSVGTAASELGVVMMGGSDALELVRSKTDGWTGSLNLLGWGARDANVQVSELAEGTADAAESANDFERRAQQAADGANGVGDAAGDAAADFETLEDRINRASEALNAWTDDSGERALISLYQTVETLSDNLGAAEIAAFDVAKGFDLTTEAGQRGAQIMSEYRGTIADVTDAYIRGDITAGQYSAATGAARAAMNEAARQAGATEAQVEALNADYDALPGAVTTEVAAKGDAWQRIRDLNNQLDGVDGRHTRSSSTHTTTRHTVYTQSGRGPRAAGGTVAALAGGGMPAAAGGGRGIETLVNEGAGEESFRMPSGDIVPLPIGGGVVTAEDTAHSQLVNGSGGPPVTIIVEGDLLTDGQLEDRIRRVARDGVLHGSFDGLGGVR